MPGPATLLSFLLLAVLPLACWMSPLPAEARWRAAGGYGVCFALCLVMATARRRRGRKLRRWLWIFLAVGAAVVLAHRRFLPNELAATLLLFVPVALGLALAPASTTCARLRRLQCALLAVLFAGGIAMTGSRGGLLGLALAAAVLAVLLGRRRGAALAAAAGLAAALALTLAGPRRAFDFLIYDDTAARFSWSALTTHRPRIWHQALDALADTPFTGLGPGGFAAVAPRLYPTRSASRPEHAHNLYLQTALDLGPGGLAALLLLLALAFRRLAALLRRAPPEGTLRPLAAGLFTALLVHAVLGLGDTVAPGRLSQLAMWTLLGLAFALPAARRPPRRPPSRRSAVALLLVAALLFALPPVRQRWLHNRAVLLAVEALLRQPPRLDEAAALLERSAATVCRGHWPRGLLAAARGRGDERRDAWGELLRCGDGFVHRMEATAPHDRELAHHVVAARPGHGPAHVWLARAYSAPAPAPRRDIAIASYRRGLALEPRQGRAWCELAALLRAEDPTAAFDAYLACCHRGDPGANGCGGAAALALARGDLEEAMRLYRLSRLAKNQQRADALEGRLAREAARE